MRRVQLCLVGVAMIASSRVAEAQTSDAGHTVRVDPSVEQVSSGGRWQVGKSTGSYRVVITREGWEEVRRFAVLEWIQEAASAGPDSVRQSIELNARAGIYALADPVFIHRGSRWLLRLKAARRPLAPYDQTVEFALGAPGSVTLVRHP